MIEKLEININNQDVINADLISSFEFEDNNKKVALFTQNELEPNGRVKILASEIVDNNLTKMDDETWDKVKNVMRDVIGAKGTEVKYINLPSQSLSADEVYSRPIAVETTAKDALAKDYMDKKPEEEVATEEVSDVSEETPSIYPTENVSVPIGSEVAEGIAETVPEEEEEVDTKFADMPVDLPLVKDDVPAEFDKVASTDEVEVPEVSEELRQELVNSIMLAVDKYVEAAIRQQTNNEIMNMLGNIENQISNMSR